MNTLGILAIAIGFVVSAVLTALIIPRIILISFKEKLFDTTDERKVHKGIVPRLGGVAFTPSIIMAIAVLFGIYTLLPAQFMPHFETAGSLSFCLCALMLIYLEGITDDLVGVPYKQKFLIQTLCATMIVVAGVWINDFDGLLGLHQLPPYIGMPFSVVLIVFIINAVNLIDGIDGLASGLSMVALFFLGCFFFHLSEMVCAVIAFATLGTLVPFFIFNVFGRAEKRQKIFMGDCGSQTIGLILSILAIRFTMLNTDDGTFFSNTLVIAFSTLMIPCLDVIRVMAGRIRRHKNPFLPDKTHIHHKFLALGMSHRTAMSTILMIDAFFVMLNIGLCRTLNINLILLIDITVWTALHVWISQIIKIRDARKH